MDCHFPAGVTDEEGDYERFFLYRVCQVKQELHILEGGGALAGGEFGARFDTKALASAFKFDEVREGKAPGVILKLDGIARMGPGTGRSPERDGKRRSP